MPDAAATPATVPLRSELPTADTWDLAQLYPDDGAWESDFGSVEADFPRYTEHRGKLASSAEALRDCLEFDRSMDLRIERLYHYAGLRVAEDSADNAHLVRMGRLQSLLTRVAETSSFLTPELQAIDDARFEEFLGAPCLAEWRIKLGKIRRFRPHTLPASEERLLALGANAVHGHGSTFSQLTNVDMRFGTVVDEDGEERPLTQSSLSSFLVRRDRDVRRRAFEGFYREIGDHGYTLASTLALSVKADVFQARARNHASAREAALFSDRVPVAVYDNLVSTVRSRLPALHRYYELRRRVLGIPDIRHYDTYVPMVPGIETDTTWDGAVDVVIGALRPLGDDYCATLEAGLRGRWCDRYETKGKRSGAFSSSSYGNPPFILMNYKRDVFSDVYTLAHEAGHSMHSWLSQSTQPFQDYDYPIFLAEVASTFNEELLTHHLLERTTDRRMRAYLVNRQIDDIRGTLFRQTMFAEFERVIHAIEEEGGALTLDTFRGEYRQLLEAWFGPGFELDEALSLECLRIPHFYSAFYVYKYATGISAAIALSRGVLGGGPSETAAYLGFLRSGGSRYPLDTLRTAGVDMERPEPVAAALDLFEARVAELESLLDG
jgi:oligoendopeptidase F